MFASPMTTAAHSAEIKLFTLKPGMIFEVIKRATAEMIQ